MTSRTPSHRLCKVCRSPASCLQMVCVWCHSIRWLTHGQSLSASKLSSVLHSAAAAEANAQLQVKRKCKLLTLKNRLSHTLQSKQLVSMQASSHLSVTSFEVMSTVILNPRSMNLCFFCGLRRLYRYMDSCPCPLVGWAGVSSVGHGGLQDVDPENIARSS